jgi:hypothetical protein
MSGKPTRAGVTYAAIVAFDGVNIGLIYLVAFVVGVMETGFSAALQSAIPIIVAEPQLTLANGWLTPSTALAGISLDRSYRLGGVRHGGLAAFLRDGASFAVSAVFLPHAVPMVPGTVGEAATRPSLRSDVAEGLR